MGSYWESLATEYGTTSTSWLFSPGYPKIKHSTLNTQTSWKIIQDNIVQVIFNEPATIIIWSNGEKTVVKTQDGEPFDREKGFLMAIAKFLADNKGNYYELIKKYCQTEIEEKESVKEKAKKENNTESVDDLLQEFEIAVRNLVRISTRTKEELMKDYSEWKTESIIEDMINQILYQEGMKDVNSWIWTNDSF